MSGVAKLRLNPDGSVLVELDAAASDEDEAVAIAVAEAMCAEINHIGDEEVEDGFLDYMRERSAAPSKPACRQRAEPPKQMLLLDHLDECQGQQLFWE